MPVCVPGGITGTIAATGTTPRAAPYDRSRLCQARLHRQAQNSWGRAIFRRQYSGTTTHRTVVFVRVLVDYRRRSWRFFRRFSPGYTAHNNQLYNLDYTDIIAKLDVPPRQV